MEAFNSMLDKVKTHPDVMDKVHSVLDKVKKHPEVIEKVAEVLHLGKHESKEKEAAEVEEKTKGEKTQDADKGASGDKTESSNILEEAVEEIQAVFAAVQQQDTDETEIPVEAAAETGTSAEGEQPEEAKREVEKDDPKKRIDFLGFFAMLFERFCSPAAKKKDQGVAVQLWINSAFFVFFEIEWSAWEGVDGVQFAAVYSLQSCLFLDLSLMFDECRKIVFYFV